MFPLMRSELDEFASCSGRMEFQKVYKILVEGTVAVSWRAYGQVSKPHSKLQSRKSALNKTRAWSFTRNPSQKTLVCRDHFLRVEVLQLPRTRCYDTTQVLSESKMQKNAHWERIPRAGTFSACPPERIQRSSQFQCTLVHLSVQLLSEIVLQH